MSPEVSVVETTPPTVLANCPGMLAVPFAWLTTEPGAAAVEPVVVSCVLGDGFTTLGCGGAGENRRIRPGRGLTDGTVDETGTKPVVVLNPDPLPEGGGVTCGLPEASHTTLAQERGLSFH